MNLVGGVLMDAGQSRTVLDELENRVLTTLQSGYLSPSAVIDACDLLAHTLDEEKYLEMMAGLGIARETGIAYLREAKIVFSRGYLEARLCKELGDNSFIPLDYVPPYAKTQVCERIAPLGVLLHIAAGNVDGLPVFSVLEGLLTGNINILKLPEVDGGVSIDLLMQLIKIQPQLAEYIYVFDYSSKDKKSISKLISVTDAVVVWGTDEAVAALRQMAGPAVKLIEWGHKISFAYVTDRGMDLNGLRGLAQNICRTDQLLCSSCQGVFIDTDDMDEVYRFCELFLPILDEVSKQTQPHNDALGIVSQVTLKLYTEELESITNMSRIFRGDSAGMIAYQDSDLDASVQFRNIWAKRLPRGKLLKNLRSHKNHLQTAALLCGPEERGELISILSKTGLVRITSGEKMSETYCGAAHDGEYPLRRYTKVFSIE